MEKNVKPESGTGMPHKTTCTIKDVSKTRKKRKVGKERGDNYCVATPILLDPLTARHGRFIVMVHYKRCIANECGEHSERSCHVGDPYMDYGR